MQRLRDIQPIILAGGHGTRLKPLTGPRHPKPFLKMGGLSLFQNTVMRCVGMHAPVIVTFSEYARRLNVELAKISVQPKTIVQEPLARSTAPAILLAIMGLDDGQVILVMPSDHVVDDCSAFQESVDAAEVTARSGALVMMGVRPQNASRRYGYIKCGCDGVIEQFVEKPNVLRAKAFFHDGGMFWNTGIFVVKAGVLKSFYRQYVPEIYCAIKKSYESSIQDGVFLEPDFWEYSKVSNISVDYAIMEKLRAARMVELKAGWSDVGCWPQYLEAQFQTIFKKPNLPTVNNL